MATFFLVLIYITFISLGLPDSLLGAVWPAMRIDLGAPLDAAGMVSLVITAGTIVSSLLSHRLIKRFGTGKVTAFSVLATAMALLGFSASQSLMWLLMLAVPLGLGAGAVDAALNNYVALHYSARHMSWLHCFWGVGASAGPLILSFWLAGRAGWRAGYLTVTVLQFCVTALLFVTLPMWKKREAASEPLPEGELPESGKKGGGIWQPGVPAALLTYLCLCAIELGVGLWGASFLAEARGLSAEVATSGAALYYFSITVGRFISGALASWFSPVRQIRFGAILVVAGAVLFLLPLPVVCSFVAIGLLGLGNAPIYPCMMHETPRRFGVANSQKLIGLQMAAAYTGSTVVPPLLGLAAARLGIWAIPAILLPIAVLLLFFSQYAEYAVKKAARSD